MGSILRSSPAVVADRLPGRLRFARITWGGIEIVGEKGRKREQFLEIMGKEAAWGPEMRCAVLTFPPGGDNMKNRHRLR